MGSEPEIRLYRGRYYAVWIENGKTKRVALRAGPNERDKAERNFHDWLKTPQGESIGDIMMSYLSEKDKTAAHPGRLHYAWDRACDTFGYLRPDQITPDLCRKYEAARYERGVGPATVRKELQTIRAGLKFAKREGGAKFHFPKQPPPKDRHLSKTEFDRLLGGCATDHVRLFCLLALHTGARASAILELDWARVDFEKRRIHYTLPDEKKPRKKRPVSPINETLLRALQKARESEESERCKWVIQYGGQRVRSVKKAFAAACERAKLESVTPHVLRHTCAVWLAEAGTSMPEIAQFLGHSDSSITERVYARYSPERLRSAADALG